MVSARDESSTRPPPAVAEVDSAPGAHCNGLFLEADSKCIARALRQGPPMRRVS